MEQLKTYPAEPFFFFRRCSNILSKLVILFKLAYTEKFYGDKSKLNKFFVNNLFESLTLKMRKISKYYGNEFSFLLKIISTNINSNSPP